MAISTAVGLERISRVVGYAVKRGFFQEETSNLPQRIAVFGEANTANQSGLTTAPFEFTSAAEVGAKYGYGSPLYQIARILRPVTSEGVGGIPTVIYPQVSDGGATATVIKYGVTGTATKNVTHYIVINGRDNIDGQSFALNIATGDDVAAVTAKMIAAVNEVLQSPVSAALATADVDFTTKWEGVTSAEVNITIDTNNDAAGLVYSQISKTAGTGTVNVATSLALFGNTWNTLVVNPYTTLLADFETFNGVPDDTTPTGRYVGIVFKPIFALFGSIKSAKADLIAITDASARKTQVTNVLCPAPNSAGCTWEAAANVAYLLAPTLQNTPHLDVMGKSYPDMPVPTDEVIGDMANYTDRDYLVKRGCSTVNLINGAYVIHDLVTTYHPDGDALPAFRYVRTLNIDWNVRYKYYVLEQINVVDHSIAESEQTVRVENVIRPKQWIQVISSLADDLAETNLISDVDFMKQSITVQTSGTNPDRLETTFRYKRSSTVRIASTTATAGFAFGVR
jgi:phage tail sheath gpL-like